ncbi:hypothetical protein [Sphingobacterium sp. BIGb0116]|uniref:hypothetical protein n=1 Tax=Sphingobacterium sp. BIGb0116 TaxID=2940619 RepID=UPI00216AA28E|nr:hypothetical protein [Sphingobacterium sp. BIGb0116]MCS4164401.1 hypothetical protein [Sphingobacterium sp. BIGb0116]
MKVAYVNGAEVVKPINSAAEKKRMDIEAFKAEFIQNHNLKFKTKRRNVAI